MSIHLKDFIGKQVDVWTLSAQTEGKDSGILRSVDEQWVVLQKGNEILFFAIARIRLVKPQL